ncbi:MAG: ABC transporter substrate-binding protein [Phenylobacterium zucineum]|nr:MAG: ABC transporter substrate-binding protein [Phenylobacterium zucineum]
MEKDANYAVVGLSTLFLFFGVVIFSVWLARFSLNRDFDSYDINFPGPISGLSQGGEVRFNGIKVGEITKIELTKSNPKNVTAHVRMGSDVPVRADSYATIEPLGITGVSFIQISAGSAARPLLKNNTPIGKVPLILSRRSALSGLLEGGGTVLARTVEALDRVNRVLSDQNIRTFGRTLDNVQTVTAELAAKKQLIGDAQLALQHIDAAAQQVTALSASSQSLVDGEGRRSLKSVTDAALETQSAAKDLRAMMGKLDGPTSEFAANGLPQLTAAVSSLQSTAQSLDRLVREIESNPQALVTKSPAAEKEVKP